VQHTVIWNLLQILLTNLTLQNQLLFLKNSIKFFTILPTEKESAPCLLYALQVLECLVVQSIENPHLITQQNGMNHSLQKEKLNLKWNELFKACGGVDHIVHVFQNINLSLFLKEIKPISCCDLLFLLRNSLLVEKLLMHFLENDSFNIDYKSLVQHALQKIHWSVCVQTRYWKQDLKTSETFQNDSTYFENKKNIF